MKISTKQTRTDRPTVSKIVIALAFASVAGGMTISPALGQHNENRENHENRARAEHDRDRHDDRNHGAYRPGYQHPYRYAQPVYAPPPVYYYPEQRSGVTIQSPGISLFFPLDLR